MTIKWGDIRVNDVISPLNGKLAFGNPGLSITGISTDSREPVSGRIFIALKGDRFDGHDFALKAVQQGASCVVINNTYSTQLPFHSDAAVITVDDTLNALGDLASWWRRQFKVQVAAITGSAGKTTTKEMASGILGLTSRTLKTKGNLNNLIGLPLTVLQLEEGISKMVLEMGMNRPGEIGRLTEIADPDVGLITNIGKAHLEGLGDIRGVARAKTELLEKMSPKGKVILNGDDELLMTESSRFKREVMTFGLRPENDVRAENLNNLGKNGISFELRYKDHVSTIMMPTPGIYNVLNVLAASSIALAMEEPFVNLAAGINGYEGLKGRFKTVSLTNNITLVDDTYNSNPSSLKAALNSVKEMAVDGRRVIVGLGEMLELGDETVSAHRDAGSMVAGISASWFFAMGDRAREMKNGAVDSGLASERVCEIETHEEMIKKIGDVLLAGDIIFLKGSRKMGLESVAMGLEKNWAKKA
jgi:UDP-N-acetylmuramoyl-tripeptide--D-alanyl-D-alanine ligase